MENCTICPRNCNRPRTGSTVCGMGEKPVVARAALHRWEEPCISGRNGSGTVFFSGCNLNCVFCQNHTISHGRFGKEVSEEKLREIFFRLIEQGAHNINLVTGSHFVPQIARALQPELPVPVVFNCGGYEKPETLQLLEGLVDVYLPDMKYMSGPAAARYSGAPNYPEVAQKAIEYMYSQVGDCRFDDDGMLVKGVMVRHLVLPGNVENSLAVIDWFEQFSRGKNVLFSLMGQYLPQGRAEQYPEINRTLTQAEYDGVVSWMELAGVENGFVQQLDSAQSQYIPDFSLQGVE